MNARVKWLQSQNLLEAIELKMVDEKILSKYVHYLIYLDYAKKMGRMQAIQFMADDRNVSFSVAWRSVNFFEEDIDKPENISERDISFFRNTASK